MRIEIGFGLGETASGLPIEPMIAEGALRILKEEAAALFGGYTLVPVEGGWMNPGGRLVMEIGKKFEIFTVPGREDMARTFARHVRDSLKQQSVMLVVDNIPELV